MKKRILKDRYSISTFTIQKIVEKWDRDEAILNMAARIKELDYENGLLKSDLAELTDSSKLCQKNKNQKIKLEEYDTKIKKQNKIIKELEQKLIKYTNV